MKKQRIDPITKKLLTDYDSVSGYISREERSEKLKQFFGLSHGKQKNKKSKK